MRSFRILPLYAAVLCAMAQTPPNSPKPPVAATPVAPSTPATPAPGITTTTGPDGPTFPISVVPPRVIPPDRVVIQVGDAKLTSAQVDLILQAYPDNQRVWADGPGRQEFIDQIVRILLLSEEGKRRKLTETDLYKTQLMYSAAGILASHTDEDVKKQARLDEASLKAYYEAHKSEWEQIHVRHILIRKQGSPVPPAPGQKDLSDEEALAKASEIRQKIVSGADFAAIAQVESTDPGSNAKGGDLGFLVHGQTVPSFEEAAFALQPGELSAPVKSTYGYHIIKMEERRATKSFEDVRADLEKNLANEAGRKFVADLKAKTKVVIDAEFGAPNGGMVEIKK